ncbi:conserved hypothetical protein [Burkholderiales bacterium 8X]|nr:conserved hypothetical protein [Burkholderiales bacterium 8X]
MAPAIQPVIQLQPLVLPPLPSSPRISIAITSYNYSRFLGACLDSCLAQSLTAAEIVVVDDGSTDNSLDLLDEYSSRHPQIKVIRQANGGICVATNTLLAACTGDVVLILDSDDTMTPDRARRVVEALRQPVDGQNPGWVHHPLTRFSDQQPDLGQAPYYEGGKGPQGWLAADTLRAASAPVLATASMLAFRREVLDAIGSLDPDRLMYQDLQLCTIGVLVSPVAFVATPLGGYRVHSTSTSAGSMVSLAQIEATRKRAVKFDAWLRMQLDKRQPGASALWRRLEDQGGYLWLCFLEKWLAGKGKDRRLLWKALRHPDTVNGPRQYRIYYYGALLLPRRLFVAYSKFIFGNNPLKTKVRKLLGRA